MLNSIAAHWYLHHGVQKIEHYWKRRFTGLNGESLHVHSQFWVKDFKKGRSNFCKDYNNFCVFILQREIYTPFLRRISRNMTYYFYYAENNTLTLSKIKKNDVIH